MVRFGTKNPWQYVILTGKDLQKSPVISGAETHFLDRRNFKIFINYRQLVILTGILYLNFQKKSIFGVFGCFSYVLALGGGVLGQDVLEEVF